MNKKEQGYNVFQNMLYLLGVALKHYKIVFLFIMLEMLCNGLLPLFGLYLPKLAVELVLDNRGLNHAMTTLGIFASAYVLIQCVYSVAANGKYPFQNNLRFIYTRALFEKALDCDYSLMETSEGRTWYEKARSAVTNGDGSATSQIFNTIPRLISGLISFAFIFGIISTLSPYILAFLIFLSASNYFLDGFALRYEKKQRDTTADLQEKSFYVERAMADIQTAKDIRIYNMPELFEGIKEKILHQAFIVRTRVSNRYFLSGGLKMLVAACRDGIAYAYCIRQVINGNVSVPDFNLYMGAIASFSAWLNGIVSSVLTLNRENSRLNDLRAFFDCTNRLDSDKPLPISKIYCEHKIRGDNQQDGQMDLPPVHSTAGTVEIEFKNVGFRYTESAQKVLDGLSFRINANEKAALVGVNGAGKTTIVKLLCGFYKATEGEILLNGQNIDQFKRSDLYTLFSAVFQDICILPVTAGENISFAKNNESDNEKILRCLETAGIREQIMKHNKGLAAPMLKAIDEDGIILSGGEQQKLLLARALYKDAPILILDEPTAALDPIAESEVYEKFHELTENKTALYISHRMASTRFCDKILMLKDGKIAESGSHDELIAKNGEYAHMFDIQSHYYKGTSMDSTKSVSPGSHIQEGAAI
jgi:ATP-binding cassette subfamily B protein/ATP-binding cassette subfamily C protein